MVKRPRLIIAGTGSGAGKTTFAIGLMAAFKRRGLNVQGFKVGPDYIDPSYHSAVTGSASRNLDTWMSSSDVMKEVFIRGSEHADLSIIEGVMGYYDGQDPRSNEGSTADISMQLSAPTLLVVNINSMARSAAAIVKGFCSLAENAPIAGVVANFAGSKGHLSLVQTAVELECGIPVVGGFPNLEGIAIPERHLGLVPAIERGELMPLFDRLADEVEANFDLDRILEIAHSAPGLALPEKSLFQKQASLPQVKIAVAKDAAFNFYYPENLELLELNGAELLYFSPLLGEKVPEQADGLYIGGGFPEEFASQLERAEEVRIDLKRKMEEGLPTFAECGGYMYLCASIRDRSGKQHQMVGYIPFEVRMQNRLAALGYREVNTCQEQMLLSIEETIRGHEYHYSVTERNAVLPYAYISKGLFGASEEGYCDDHVTAGYTHLYFPSNPSVPKRFVEACLRFQEHRAAKSKSL